MFIFLGYYNFDVLMLFTIILNYISNYGFSRGVRIFLKFLFKISTP